jgi:hypothetical protein
MATDGNTNRRKLVDILSGDAGSLQQAWDSTPAAGDFAPLPTGTYTAHVQSLAFFKARSGTPGVKLEFRVCEGEHVGRHVWFDLWLTAAALPQTKRDCAKLGITQLDQIERNELPPGRIRCAVRVVLRADDSGTKYNRVRGFEVTGKDDPEADPFAPADETDPPTEGRDNAAAEPGGDPDAETGDTSFNFGFNAESETTAKAATEWADGR